VMFPAALIVLVGCVRLVLASSSDGGVKACRTNQKCSRLVEPSRATGLLQLHTTNSSDDSGFDDDYISGDDSPATEPAQGGISSSLPGAKTAKPGEMPSEIMMLFAGGSFLAQSKTLDKETFKNGVKMNKNRVDSDADDIFSLKIPNDGKVNLVGSVTISRCNEKDILGKSSDKKGTPCYSVCGKGGNVKNCYPWKGSAKAYPTLHVKVSIPGHEDACNNCGWKEHRCMKDHHHCTVVLMGCTCQVQKGWVAKLVATSSTDGPEPKSNWIAEVEDKKGFLAAYGGEVKDSASSSELLNGKKHPAENDPDKSSYKPSHFHIFDVDVPKVSGEIAVARATVQIELNPWDSHFNGGKPKDSCWPLVRTQLMTSSGKLAGTATKSGDKKFRESIFDRLVTQNCKMTDDFCTYDVVEAAYLKDLPKNAKVTLVVNVHKSCVNEGKDYFQIKQGSVTVDVLG